MCTSILARLTCAGAASRRVSSVVVALVAASSASAELTNTFVQTRASASDLTEAGFEQLGASPFVSLPSGDCAVNGCVTLAGSQSNGIAKGFLEFQFFNYTYNPLYYSGNFTVLDIDYGASSSTLNQLIALINAETATTGVTALTTAQANNASGTCSFNEWLPAELSDGLVLNWTPPTPPTNSGLSQVFRFAWDFSSLTPQLLGESVKVRGAYAVPSPGALAVLGLGGLLVRRRR
ncbi:MAG: hypothetical protein RIR10_843 [Planctomycetota bacterium]|jgi:MYXO-CTERM domain-containing protein